MKGNRGGGALANHPWRRVGYVARKKSRPPRQLKPGELERVVDAVERKP